MRLDKVVIKVIVFVCFFSCSGKSSNATKGEIREAREVTTPVQSGLNLCQLKTWGVQEIKMKIIDNTEEVLKSINTSANNEVCFFDLINTIVETDNLDERSLEAIERLAQEGDGFSSEFLMDISLKLFHENFTPFFDYLYQNQETEIVELLSYGLSMDLSLTGTNKQEVLDETLLKVETKDEKEFVRRIFMKVDPSKFD